MKVKLRQLLWGTCLCTEGNALQTKINALQNTVQLCCTVYQRSLYIVAVVRMCKGLDCVCPQINAARVENCWLQDSFQTVPQQSSQTSNTYSDKKPLHALHSFVHQNERPYKSQRCLGICLKTGSQTLAPRYPTFFSTTVLSFRFRVNPTGNKVAPLSGRVSALQRLIL